MMDLSKYQPIQNVPGTPPPPDVTPNEVTVDPKTCNLTCTDYLTCTKVPREIVGEEHAHGTVYGI